MEKINYTEWSKNFTNDSNDVVNAIVTTKCGTEFEIAVKKYIPVSDRIAFVSEVLSMCFNDGDYVYGVDDFAIKVCLVQYYTNVDCNADVGFVERLIYGSNIIDIIRAANDDDRFVIESQCRDAIENARNAINRVASKVGAFIEELETVMNFIEEHPSVASGIIGGGQNLTMNGGDVNGFV